MKKRNQPLNKIERMLLESRFPTLRILLEEESEKVEDPPKEEKSEATDNDKAADNAGGGLSDLFGSSGDDGGGDAEATTGDDAGGDAEAAPEDDGAVGDDAEATSGEEEIASDAEGEGEAGDKSKNKEEEEKKIKDAVKKAMNAFTTVTGDVVQPGTFNINDKLFGESNFNRRQNFQMRRLQENISKYLFKNVKMKSIRNKKTMSLKNSFSMNENKLLKINGLINEATSVDEMINNKFWEDNTSIDLIVDNAINLTKNFQNLVDIPALIMNSVAIKFGRQASEEVSDNQSAANEYKTKLEEFLDKYTKAIQQLPDYEHYDVSKYRFNMVNPDKQAVGAFSPGG